MEIWGWVCQAPGSYPKSILTPCGGQPHQFNKEFSITLRNSEGNLIIKVSITYPLSPFLTKVVTRYNYFVGRF